MLNNEKEILILEAFKKEISLGFLYLLKKHEFDDGRSLAFYYKFYINIIHM